MNKAEPETQHATLPVTPDLQWEIEHFLRAEARLLDTRRFDEWLELLTDDVHYYMPVRSQVYEDQMREGFNAGFGGANFDEDKERLRIRVAKLSTGRDHVERPHSMLRHHITNVYVELSSAPDCYEVCSYFIVTRLRHGRFRDIYSGERTDELKRANNPYGWQIAKRTITLDETTLLGGGIGFLF